MENHIYTYSPTNYRVVGGASPARFLDPDAMYLSHHHHRADAGFHYTSASAASDADIAPPGVASRNPSATIGSNTSSAAHLLSQASSWPVAIAAAAAAANAHPAAFDLKRPSESLYHPTILGIPNTIGQSEAWYSTNALAKRPRFETGSNLPIYPQRPGEKDCAHYMLTRTCKFGEFCKFDHPIWVPEGGIPDWKEVPNIVASDALPERPGEPDCPYFLKTQRCKFGSRCKFNHPKASSENADVSALPERPSEPLCAFYVKTGKCKFGAVCKFHHPKDILIQMCDEPSRTSEKTQPNSLMEETAGDSHNSKGLPIRSGEVNCPFYMKTGSCKYGGTCRYNHPDWNAANLSIGVINPALSVYQAFDPRFPNPMSHVGVAGVIYPQRPGEIECDFYMKTGECKYGERCKFHHPVDRSAPSLSNQALQQTVKLTPAGLPRREGAVICPYYLKTGTCKFGATCRFDHPPPGEVMEMAKSQGTSATTGDEA